MQNHQIGFRAHGAEQPVLQGRSGRRLDFSRVSRADGRARGGASLGGHGERVPARGGIRHARRPALSERRRVGAGRSAGSRLLGKVYVFGTPTSLLLRSEDDPQPEPFLRRGQLSSALGHGSLLRGSQWSGPRLRSSGADVHAPQRRGAHRVSQRLGSSLPEHLAILKQYGPANLTEDEYRRRPRGHSSEATIVSSARASSVGRAGNSGRTIAASCGGSGCRRAGCGSGAPRSRRQRSRCFIPRARSSGCFTPSRRPSDGAARQRRHSDAQPRARCSQPRFAARSSQTLTDHEILVVDDASEDETPQVVSAIRGPRVTYLRGEGRRGRSRGAKRRDPKLARRLYRLSRRRRRVVSGEARASRWTSFAHSREAPGFVYSSYRRRGSRDRASRGQKIAERRGDVSREILASNVVGGTSCVVVQRDAFERGGLVRRGAAEFPGLRPLDSPLATGSRSISSATRCCGTSCMSKKIWRDFGALDQGIERMLEKHGRSRALRRNLGRQSLWVGVRRCREGEAALGRRSMLRALPSESPRAASLRPPRPFTPRGIAATGDWSDARQERRGLRREASVSGSTPADWQRLPPILVIQPAPWLGRPEAPRALGLPRAAVLPRLARRQGPLQADGPRRRLGDPPAAA